MRRNNAIFLILFSLFSVFAFGARAQEPAELIFLTNEDVENYKKMQLPAQMDFLIDFYKKNKGIGATDGQILNEILKLDVTDGENSSIVRTVSLAGKQFKDMEGFFDSAVQDLNQSILERNPGRTDLLIDVNDSSTWENIKYIVLGEKTIQDYLNMLSKDIYFSDNVVTDSGVYMTASCANKKNGAPVLMSFLIVPQQGYSVLMQKEGQPEIPVQADFSGSENLLLGSLIYPAEKVFSVDGQKAFGFQGPTYLTFYADINDPIKNSTLKARLKLTVCHNNICREETTPQMVYKVQSARMESPVCSRLTQEQYNAPVNRSSGIEIKKVFFKKDGEDVDLLVSLKIPFFGSGEPSMIVKNSSGILFSEPFMTMDGKKALFKIRVLNPEMLKKETPLTFQLSYANKYAEFEKTVGFEKSFFSFLKFSPVDLFIAFVLGIKFLIFTPLLAVFLMFIYQLMFIADKTSEKTVDFFNGLGKSFYCCVIAGAALFVLCAYILPPGMLFWGVQFSFPLFNAFFLILFLIAAMGVMRVFDDAFMEKILSKGEVFFYFLDIDTTREKSGFAVGLTAGVLLLITPMTGLYFDVYILLLKSPVFYSAAFLAGIVSPFLLMGILDEKAEMLPESIETARRLEPVIMLPLLFPAVVLLIIIGMETGMSVCLGTLVLAALLYVACKSRRLVRFPRKYIFAAALMLGVLFIPLLPNSYNMNNYGAAEFSEEILRHAVKDGRAVYVNVTESSCISCQWSRLMVIHKGGPKEIRDGDLLVMGISYKHPFLRRLLMESGTLRLPMNMMFSPVAPEGKILPDVIGPWAAKDIVRQAVEESRAKLSPVPKTLPREFDPGIPGLPIN